MDVDVKLANWLRWASIIFSGHTAAGLVIKWLI